MDVLENIGQRWMKMGYDQLGDNDYARLEPFVEPFDAIYTDQEVSILSRVGQNGVQKEFCSLYVQPPQGGSAPNRAQGSTGGVDDAEIWVLEWYLTVDDIRRDYLRMVSRLLYGESYENDETQCILMLTYAIAELRRLKLTIQGETISGVALQEDEIEVVAENSLDEPSVDDEYSLESHSDHSSHSVDDSRSRDEE
jgi:hypothetical protein